MRQAVPARWQEISGKVAEKVRAGGKLTPIYANILSIGHAKFIAYCCFVLRIMFLMHHQQLIFILKSFAITS